MIRPIPRLIASCMILAFAVAAAAQEKTAPDPLKAGFQNPPDERALTACLVALDEREYLEGRHQARPRVDASRRSWRLPQLRRCPADAACG